jgi:hypothetical protein
LGSSDTFCAYCASRIIFDATRNSFRASHQRRDAIVCHFGNRTGKPLAFAYHSRDSKATCWHAKESGMLLPPFMKLSLPKRLFVAGFIFRLAIVGYLVHVRPNSLAWGVNEAGAIARSMVLSHAYLSPYASGLPTAWLAPVYPALISLAFTLFGIQTSASVVAMMLFNIACSALTGVICYRIGQRCFGERAGQIAGWAWALCPYIAMMPYILWDSCLAALLLAYAPLLTLRLDESRKKWLGCGMIWGISSLVSTSLLAPLPCIIVYLFIKKPMHRAKLGLLLSTLVLCVSPWIIRNKLVMHEAFPVRSNGWAEIYFANLGYDHHPLSSTSEYQKLGETQFVNKLEAEAVLYIRTHPKQFLQSSVKRATEFWTFPVWIEPWFWSLLALALLGLWRSRSLILASAVIFYPLIYYASLSYARYRYPIEPILYVSAGFAVLEIHAWLTSFSASTAWSLWTRDAHVLRSRAAS